MGNRVATLKVLSQQHGLVAETDARTQRQLVRGGFSATQLRRQLGIEIQTFEIARTFAEIGAALAG